MKDTLYAYGEYRWDRKRIQIVFGKSTLRKEVRFFALAASNSPLIASIQVAWHKVDGDCEWIQHAKFKADGNVESHTYHSQVELQRMLSESLGRWKPGKTGWATQPLPAAAPLCMLYEDAGGPDANGATSMLRIQLQQAENGMLVTVQECQIEDNDVISECHGLGTLVQKIKGQNTSTYDIVDHKGAKVAALSAVQKTHGLYEIQFREAQADAERNYLPVAVCR